jgi:branched-chain amino acid transport system substrate-binding protein
MRPVSRSGVGIAAAIATLALLAAVGCGSDSSGKPGLTVYLSAPLTGPAAGDGNDIVDGARLALDDAGHEVGDIEVRLEVFDDADRHGSSDALAGANARRATEDSTAIAYIGELDSGTTRTSLPITNEAGMLQVSAGASAVDLTRAAPGSSQIPTEVQPGGSRTFGRVIPSDTVQGAAAAVSMTGSEVGSAEVLDAKSPYGQSLLDGFTSVGDGPSVASSSGSADAIYVASDRPQTDILPAGGNLSAYGADAQIVGSPPRTELGGGAMLVSGAMAPSQLPGQHPTGASSSPAATVLPRFASRYLREPGRFAAYGYEAMAVVLDSIGRADDPLDRRSVLDAFFATTDRESILGTYSIDDVGDTTLPQVGAYEAVGGGALRPAPAPITVP